MAERKGPFCAAARRNGAGNCKRDAGAGTDHKGYGSCSWHGGSSPSGRQSAAERRIEDQAQKLLYQHDATPVTDHLAALQRLAGRALALEEAIGTMVNELSSLRYEGRGEGGSEQLRAEVAVLERAMDRAGRLLVDIAKLNIEERMAKVTEMQVQIVGDALAAALREMGLSAEQQREARRGVARHLRIVA